MQSTGTSRNGGIQTWFSVVGARPQFVKLSPLCRAIESHNHNGGSPQIVHRIIHTGQHYDREVAELFFVQMGIPKPNQNLAVGSGTHGLQLARMLERLEKVLINERPDWVIVYGDTNSTLAGALVAARLEFPLAHVEAGCRGMDMSTPEEQSRICVDHLSRLLLAPSMVAMEHLHREGIGDADDPFKRRAAFVGDVMYDALLANLEQADRLADENLGRLRLKPGGYYLLTLHRAENTKTPERLRQILDAAGSLDLPVLFPVHPRTAKVMAAAGIEVPRNIRTIPPQGYLDMLSLEKPARMILTDSGGVQKEAFFLHVPCITLRERTEWTETVDLGANFIAGSDPERIREAVEARKNCNGADHSAAPYGDGRASQKILEQLLATA